MRKHRGFMLVELFVAGVVVAMLLTFCLQLIGAAVAQRRAADLRQCAILEVGNLMERIAAKPWDEITTENLSQEKLSETAGCLPSAELKCEIFETPSEPTGKRITVSLRWQDDSNQYVAPIRLTLWRFQSALRRLGEVDALSLYLLAGEGPGMRAAFSPRPLGEGPGVRAVAYARPSSTIPTADLLAKELPDKEVER